MRRKIFETKHKTDDKVSRNEEATYNYDQLYLKAGSNVGTFC